MNYRHLLFVLALFASILLWPEDDTQAESAGKADLQEFRQSSNRRDTHSANALVEDIIPQTSETTEALFAARLTKSHGRQLVSVLEQFWRGCLSQGDCTSQLASMKPSISDFHYQLLVHYPALTEDWQRVWGNAELSERLLLPDKVAEFKQLAVMVWGEFTNAIFADEFALYEFSIEQLSLAEVAAENFVDNYHALLAKWQTQEQLLSLTNQRLKYEKGVNLIPNTYTSEQKQAVKQQLAKRYLTDAEWAVIVARDEQVARQTDKVNQYRTKLSALHESLDNQKQRTNLSDREWQTYVEQKISQFRKEYFQHQ
ncbi:chromosome segregation ATPase [Vibrio zhanjiangensis]|uniref:Chromosome segregation ATPase n=1 Tax=Vibrio zhanjiangensis TaxID=1046128 RepID=A0ABQ6EY88_9VIBR|nr:chromosome segregation ATPase [Vibrio zhanjiangensis]GLT17495.1 chromosome segregation ATPase [Vibrio zhanjiangensis]